MGDILERLKAKYGAAKAYAPAYQRPGRDMFEEGYHGLLDLSTQSRRWLRPDERDTNEPIGFVENIERGMPGLWRKTPVLGTMVGAAEDEDKLARLNRLQRFANEGFKTTADILQQEEDARVLEDYLAPLLEEQRRGKTFMAKAGSVVAGLPKTFGEFGLAASAGPLGYFGLSQTMAMENITARTLANKLEGKQESGLKTLVKAETEAGIELLTEAFVGRVARWGLKKPRGLVGKLVKKTKAGRSISELMDRPIGKVLAEVGEKAKFHGVPEELLEENVAAVLRAGLRLDDQEGDLLTRIKNAIPDLEDQAAMTLAFALFPGAKIVAGATDVAASALEKRRAKEALLSGEDIPIVMATAPEAAERIINEEPSRKVFDEVFPGVRFSQREREMVQAYMRNMAETTALIPRQQAQAPDALQPPQQQPAEAPVQEVPEQALPEAPVVDATALEMEDVADKSDLAPPQGEGSVGMPDVTQEAVVPLEPTTDDIARQIQERADEGPTEPALGALGALPQKKRAGAPDFRDVLPPDVVGRIDRSRGAKPRAGLKERLANYVKQAKSLFRAQQHIPNTPVYASANEFFRLAKEIPQASSDHVLRNVASIVDALNDDALSLMEYKLIIDNQLAAIQRGEPLRHGWQSEAQVQRAKANIDALVAASPEVSQAIADRTRLVRSLTKDLVDHDLLPEEALDNPAYFHQQVLSKMEEQRIADGSAVRPKTRGFQKKRVKGTSLGPEYDYNTSYLEAETKWMTDAEMELRKEKALRNLGELYDITDDLKAESERTDTPIETLIPEGYEAWQPVPGNYFYKALTVPEQVIEQIQNGTLTDITKLPNSVRKVLAVGGARDAMILPKPVVAQLDATVKKPSQGIANLSQELMKTWKVWTLLNPKRALSYNIRNITGDIDPVIGGAPGVLGQVKASLRELHGYYSGKRLKLDPDVQEARDLGVISSSLTAQEIPDLKDLEIFKRFYSDDVRRQMSKGVITDSVNKYFSTVKRWSEFRESMLRLAAYKHYKKALSEGTLTHYGGSKKAVVEALAAEQGVDVAAAHLSRNLLGDYGNMSVMGDHMRKHVMPFWSWIEVNMKRYPRMAINAVEWAKANSNDRKAAVAALSVAGLAQIGAMYGAQALWNHFVFPDEEEQLGTWDRQNPHINLGRTEDGWIRVFRNAGALGDFLEFFGVNDLVNLLPEYIDDQVEGADIIREMAKAPINKLAQALRPDIKDGLVGVVGGFSMFPDVFNWRRVDRGEAASGIVGLADEYREVRGRLTQDGSRARPNYIERNLVGISDPRRNAMSEMYALREKFLRKEGKDAPNFFGISPARNMRYAAMNGDYDAFVEARKDYLAKGKSTKAFLSVLKRLDPISGGMSKALERKFEREFLNTTQLKKLELARDYARELRVRMYTWWAKASQPE